MQFSPLIFFVTDGNSRKDSFSFEDKVTNKSEVKFRSSDFASNINKQYKDLHSVMAAIVSKSASARTTHDVVSSFSSKWYSSVAKKKLLCSFRIRACQSMANNKDIYKQVGLFQNAVFFCVRPSTFGFA